MKTLAVILAFRCFLFFCPPPVHHVNPPATTVDRFCDGIKNAFAKTKDVSRDKFVAAFPADKRDQVKDCLGD